jgi:ribose 5-phosphate isomerase B
MKIAFGCDHGGFDYKDEVIKFLQEKGHTVKFFGTFTSDSCDYPDIAYPVAESVRDNEFDMGVLICGTGIGMSIALNKMKGIYCAKVSTQSESALCKAHNNANVIAISEEMDKEIMKDVIKTFIETPFSNIDRYKIRNNKIKDIENNV